MLPSFTITSIQRITFASCLFVFYLLFVSVAAKSTFNIRILELQNILRKRLDGTCCGEVGSQTEPCTKPCSVSLHICLESFDLSAHLENREAYNGPCLYGQKKTEDWGNSGIVYNPDAATIFSISIDGAWPQSFSLILEAFDRMTYPQGHVRLIDRVIYRGVLGPDLASTGTNSARWHRVSLYTRSSVGFIFEMRVSCARNYYNETCEEYCIDVPGRYQCNGQRGNRICESGWSGKRCDKAICQVGCHPMNGYCDQPEECKCLPGWQGATCTECKPYPGCQHGTCNNSPWTCECFPNWGGYFCDKDLDYCSRNSPCKNGGVCKNLDPNGDLLFECICPRGFTGKSCEEKTEACSLNPCKRGKCTSINGIDYSCECDPGWRGKDCDENINECRESQLTTGVMPCQNGGICMDLDTVGYSCDCPSGFTGANCHLHSSCGVRSRCKHAKDCEPIPNRDGDSRCICQPGWTGTLCDENIDECLSGPCLNNGTCQDLVNSFECQCSPGYIGTRCEINALCSLRPCQNDGLCQQKSSGYECACPQGFSGKHCEMRQSGCRPNPCLNGAFCYELNNDFYCKCATNYWGKRCEHQRPFCGETGECHFNFIGLDLCSTPIALAQGRSNASSVNNSAGEDSLLNHLSCGSHGTCIPVSHPSPLFQSKLDSSNNGKEIKTGFQCICDPGFTGTFCQININDCSSSPCVNGGICLDGTLSYQCLCPPGYEGDQCQFKINLCDPNPCQGEESVCEMVPDSLAGVDFECRCPPYRWGRWCQWQLEATPSIRCPEETCLNGGQCLVDRQSKNGFRCRCAGGWRGPICQFGDPRLSQCAQNPCRNGGTCVPVGDRDFHCICSHGYEGTRCETNTNECNTNPCMNNGKCHDLVNSYECSCPPGFVGRDCHINVDECYPNPCAHGATCLDGIGKFDCRCPEGRIGILCDDVKVPSDYRPKPPACDFHGRLFDDGESWSHNCNRCNCSHGNITCKEEYCGEWSCEKARGIHDPYACKSDEICHVETVPPGRCFVPPCFSHAICVSKHVYQNKTNLISHVKLSRILPITWPSSDSGSQCRPNVPSQLHTHCARLRLRYEKSHLPYDVTVDDICSAIRNMTLLRKVMANALQERSISLGISCDIFSDDQSTIEVALYSTALHVTAKETILSSSTARTGEGNQQMSLQETSLLNSNSGKERSQPWENGIFIHKVAELISQSLKKMESPSPFFNGLSGIQILTFVSNDDQSSVTYLVLTVLGVFSILFLLFLMAIVMHHRHQVILLRRKYAPLQPINNIGDPLNKQRPTHLASIKKAFSASNESPQAGRQIRQDTTDLQPAILSPQGNLPLPQVTIFQGGPFMSQHSNGGGQENGFIIPRNDGFVHQYSTNHSSSLSNMSRMRPPLHMAT